MQQLQSIAPKTEKTRISSRNQTVVPAGVRRTLNLRPSDVLLWQIVHTGGKTTVIAEPQPKSWTTKSRGVGKEIWQNINLQAYINNLRQEWQSRAWRSSKTK